MLDRGLVVVRSEITSQLNYIIFRFIPVCLVHSVVRTFDENIDIFSIISTQFIMQCFTMVRSSNIRAFQLHNG